MPQQFNLSLSPFTFHINTSDPSLFTALQQIYPATVLTTDTATHIIDFKINYRKKPFSFSQALAFRLGDQHFRFTDKNQLVPMFEWGLNWCVATFQSRYLCIHAAVLEKQGQAVILPAPPGSGKSTLCTMLMLEGWRLLSDEHCLIDPDTGAVVPCVRPISLKNNSIQVIKQLYPAQELRLLTPNTHKGTMAYLPPSIASWQSYTVKAQAAVVIFPQYNSECSTLQLAKLNDSQLFMQLAVNSFNYSVLGELGFTTMQNLVKNCAGYRMEYADGFQAIACLESMLQA